MDDVLDNANQLTISQQFQQNFKSPSYLEAFSLNSLVFFTLLQREKVYFDVI